MGEIFEFFTEITKTYGLTTAIAIVGIVTLLYYS